MKLIFCLQINFKSFFIFTLTFQVCVARYVQITQNNKFAISLQYRKKEVSNEVFYLRADKHESLLQIDRILILMGMVRHCRNSQNSKFAMSLQYLKKEVRDKVDFLEWS